LLCASAAFGQSYTSGPTLSTSLQPTSHPARATQQALSQDQDLRQASSVVIAQGERPVWEFAQPLETTPLGDIAREFRKERATTKKATIVRAD
jgi:hypothetical protein